MLMSCFALSHFLTTPNIASVVGGKARWLVQNGGFTSAFWGGAGCIADMLPAYPPCLSMLIVGINLMSGSSDVWMERLIGVFPLPLLYLSCCKAAPRSIMARIFAIVFLFSPIGITVFSSLYPDGLMLAFHVAGILRISKKSKDVLGWFFLGASSWVKNEGVVFAFIIMILFVGVYRRFYVPYVMAMLIIPVVWFCLSRGLGATLPDYSLANFSINRALLGCIVILKKCPSIILYSMGVIVSINYYFAKNKVLCLLQKGLYVSAFLIAIVIFSSIYALGFPDRMEWQVATSAPRLFWGAAFLLCFSCIAVNRRACAGRKFY